MTTPGPTDGSRNGEAGLYPRWFALAHRLGAGEAKLLRWFVELERRYGEPGRFYHTFTHLAEVFAALDRIHTTVPIAVAVELAAWFHDVVYDSRATDNEERSAALADLALDELAQPSSVRTEVGRLILVTKKHRPEPDDSDGIVLVDADLAILGASVERYAAYTQAIRQEYSWVPDLTYRMGRTAVLEAFLRRPRMFQTQPLFEAYEAQARWNVQQEIRALA